MRSIWTCVRLAIADALILMIIVIIFLVGIVTLIFGFPKEVFSDCHELISILGELSWIMLLVAVVMFFANWERKGRSG